MDALSLSLSLCADAEGAPARHMTTTSGIFRRAQLNNEYIICTWAPCVWIVLEHCARGCIFYNMMNTQPSQHDILVDWENENMLHIYVDSRLHLRLSLLCRHGFAAGA